MDISRLVDKLSEEQQKNALMVAEEAIRQGVNPNLAVAIAYQESKLLTNVRRGNDGEYGIMQVLPSTGKEMGFDENALQDPAKNIAAGIQYIKRGLQETGGDTKLTAAFYNGGPGAIVALREGKSPDPRVLNYVRSLSGLGVFAEPEQKAEPSSAPPEAAPGDLVSVPNPEVAAAPPQTDTSGASPGERMLGAGLGTVAGTASTLAQGVSDTRSRSASSRAYQEGFAGERGRMAAQTAPAAPGGAPAAPRAPVATPTAPAAPGAAPIEPTSAQATRILQGTTGDAGTTGRARMSGFNTETSQASAAQKQAYEAAERLKRLGLVAEDAPEFFARQQGLTSTPSGVLVPRSTPAPTLGPRGPQGQIGGGLPPPPAQLAGPAALGVAPPAPAFGAAPTTATPTSGLDKVNDIFKRMMRPVATAASTVGKYALPPVAGLSAGLDLAEIAHEYDKPADQRDPMKVALRGASALGGALSMVPITAPVGVPLAIGAGGIQAYREDPEMFKKLRRRIFSSDATDPQLGVSP